MKKKVQISLIVLVTIVLLTALTVPALAEKPDKFFNLNFVFAEMDYVNCIGVDGDFWSTGAIDDEGSVSIYCIPYWGVFRGTMTFVSEAGNKFVARIQTGGVDETNCAYGQFKIVEHLGTGVYEGVEGSGRITVCRPIGSHSLLGDLDGFAIYP